jgi:hypothetical protein
MAGSRESVARCLKAYVAALIRYQRLHCIHAARAGTVSYVAPRLGDRISWRSGFYPPERWKDHVFRWSEPAAAVRIEGRPGPTTIRIESAPVCGSLERIGLRFFLDDRCIASKAITYGDNVIEVQVDLPPSGIGTLAWTCRRLRAAADPRRLGMPVAGMAIGP